MNETIILATVGVMFVGYFGYRYVQHVGLESIREKVYKLFIEAEHEFQHGDNTEKFEYVVNMAKAAVPSPFNLFITEKLLRRVVQAWFDLCKDLLDDGKLNGTKEG